ncbi:hypothetical protein CKALI_04480 [Corynebacterium kalinowskii]|uniref:Transcription termination factor Rho n=1 Tax=Corynebacterium kalinowskii TaxID=2675216 RepID=A0A6B8VJX4_9CORY|nr:transcription termination factor Rho [Corynebacterium kalinowskii]QGU01774.1 hypothetical protein CKALI_04480 [Corynebacterium kalinowskii]
MTQADSAAQNDGAPINLVALRMPELRKIAEERGIRGISGLRKSELIAAIQSGGKSAPANSAPAKQEPAPAPAPEVAETAEVSETRAPRRRRAAVKTSEAAASEPQQAAVATEDSAQENSEESGNQNENKYESRSAARRARRNRARSAQRDDNHREDHQREDTPREESQGDQASDNERHEANESQRSHESKSEPRRDNRSDDQDRSDSQSEGNHGEGNSDRGDRGDRGDRRGRRNRRERGRGRRDRDNREPRDSRDSRDNNDEIREDDVLQPVGGILDIVDNNVSFVRTTGYQAGPADVFVTQQMIRKFGLRRGDAITGQVKMPRDGQGHQGGNRGRQKYNALVRVDSVNGKPVEEARNRPDFAKLTPLYPNQRLRLETDPKILTTRVIDLIMPIGKGQRALIVSPPKAGKTTILQNIANAIATNNPECYLMVVLVDERPEEVTDMQRSVKGEVIASTFDRPPGEHTAVAELAIERAKRLVEQGQDVVVLLDSITRLGRAYNNSSPASGRILSGGVDSNALYPPKRFLGAARNIENGGSLTIIATAMVETGSAGDTVIFEEFKGTGNAELKLDRKISERRVFPAVDVNPSGTRKDELLLVPEEARIMHKLRRILSALDNQQAIDLLIKQLKKTKSNGEFLMQVASSAPMAADASDEEEYS